MITEESIRTTTKEPKEHIEYDLNKGFKDLDKLYREKKKKLLEDYFIQKEIENYWNLLTKDFSGEIDKRNFMNLFSKIYYLLLPKFNHEEITNFIDNEWQSCNKG